jgi:hypothetical protein
MGSLFSLIPLALKYGPVFVQIVRMLAPVLKDAGPIFQDLAKRMPQDEAAQKAVAVAAPYIRTPPELRHSDPTSDRMSDPY